MSDADGFALHMVLGTGRCGSTLVHEVLARHDDVGFMTNIDDRAGRAGAIERLNGPLYRRLPPGATRKGRVRFAPSEGYAALTREVGPLLESPSRDLTEVDVTPWLADRFGRFFSSRAEAQGRDVFLHKFTGWPRAGFVHAVFPGARFVHVVRDGRAVANSWLQMPWWQGHLGPGAWHFGPLPPDYADEWEASGRSFVLLAGLAWKLLIDAFGRARAAVPSDQWLDVRYEDVVADPQGRIDEILDFIGLARNPAFDRQLARYRFSAGRTEAYRADLGAADRDLLDASLAGHLARYGYAV